MSRRERWKDRYTQVDFEAIKEKEKRKEKETILAVSKIFQYGKTTIPRTVRVRLEIDDGDTLVWSVDNLGNISVTKGHPEDSK
jgi:hypothetical protein